MKKVFLAISISLLLAAGCNNQQVSTQPVVELPARQQIQVSQKVEGEFSDKLFNFYADENKTALDLLQANYKVDVKNSTSTGETVLSIDGNKPDSKHFWEFFVNGKSSSVGASSYKPVNGDKLEWKLSIINPSK